MKNITQHNGKGGSQELLPNRHAMSQLTAGDAFQRSINNYAKVTPSGEGALASPSVIDMSQVKY
jgi:hypothetical protein